jgi:hypothetical protein
MPAANLLAGLQETGAAAGHDQPTLECAYAPGGTRTRAARLKKLRPAPRPKLAGPSVRWICRLRP